VRPGSAKIEIVQESARRHVNEACGAGLFYCFAAN